MIRDPVGRAWGPPVLIGGLRQQLPAPAALEIHSKDAPTELGLPAWLGYWCAPLYKNPLFENEN